MKRFLAFLWDAIGDLTTAAREGGLGSALSSRRLLAIGFGAGFFLFSRLGIEVLMRVTELSWEAIVAFVPAAMCLIGAIFFSYFSTIKDVQETAKEIGGAIKGFNE